MSKTDIRAAGSEGEAAPWEEAFADFQLDLRRFIESGRASLPGDREPWLRSSERGRPPTRGRRRALTSAATRLMGRTPGATEDRFADLARRLFALQYEAVTPYRRLCQRRGLAPDNTGDWRAIPALPTAAFKDYLVTSLQPRERTTVFHSSGTTGHRPSRHFHNAASRALYEASLLPWFQAHLGPEAGQGRGALNFVALTPEPDQAPHSSLAHMFGALLRRWGGTESAFVGAVGPEGDWFVDDAAAGRVLERCVAAKRPVCLLGTAFAYVHLLDAMRANGKRFALPPGSRALETGGYKGRSRVVPMAELHELIQSALGIAGTHVVREYGMSELSSQAYDTAVPGCGAWAASPAVEANNNNQSGATNVVGVHTGSRTRPSTLLRKASGPARPDRVFHFPPWARAVVASPEDGSEVAEGETGLLRVVDLANVRSVLAVQTEDLAVRRGVGFELIGRARGAEPRGCSLRAGLVLA